MTSLRLRGPSNALHWLCCAGAMPQHNILEGASVAYLSACIVAPVARRGVTHGWRISKHEPLFKTSDAYL